MWILPFRIFSRAVGSGRIKTLLRVGKGKQRIVHALYSLNEATVKRQTTYEDLRMLKSVKPQDFMLSLDVESAFFHVPIQPKHRKFFSSHLTLPLFVNNKFIELHPGGYFVCSRPDLAPPVPSAQTPLHLRHHYHQVVEFGHAALPLGWTNSTRIWTIVMSVVAAALRRHGMSTLLYVDDLLIVCSSFEEASRARQIIEDTLLAAGIVRAPLLPSCTTKICLMITGRNGSIRSSS
jgi:hypothetical protein